MVQPGRSSCRRRKSAHRDRSWSRARLADAMATAGTSAMIAVASMLVIGCGVRPNERDAGGSPRHSSQWDPQAHPKLYSLPTAAVRAAAAPESRTPTIRNDADDTVVEDNGQPIVVLQGGRDLRFRTGADDPHWIGTHKHPVNLSWKADTAPEALIEDVDVEAFAGGFSLRIRGRKPQRDNAHFETHIWGRAQRDNRWSYRFSSWLQVKPATRPRHVEFLDLWFDAMFWPQRDGHERERFPWLVFRQPGQDYEFAPKLHLFPSLPGATYRTLVQPLVAGTQVLLLDGETAGHRIRVARLPNGGNLGLCWWAWDTHFFALARPGATKLEYEVLIDSVPPAEARAIVQRAGLIPFWEDAEYQLPVFSRDTMNRFDKLIDQPNEWSWEPHSHACLIDPTIGYDDNQSVTIIKSDTGRTAWYTRTVGGDYFDHRKPQGRHRVSVMARTRDVQGEVRVGVICYRGGESLLYAEHAPAVSYSQSLSGTQEWMPLSVEFDPTGFNRHKIVLEHVGTGQSWFDNVMLEPLTATEIASEAP